ncbi:M23 family metallopeptidase [Sphingomonas asaccharolytica]|uniref:M23 family metallopeptidase n=1 Tax=Sphingomonas asaccharolytica TaxID=40681 RepID=UPI0008325152|nr:M23 family metallopeptidase [Sphingomonas asaccharolytica]
MLRSLSPRMIAVVLALAGSGGVTLQSPARPAVPVHQAQVECRFLATPQAVRGSDGKVHLAYELRVTSFHSGDRPLRLTSLAIYPDGGSTPLQTIAGAALSSLLSRPPEKAGDDGIAIAGGQTQTLFLWLTLPAGVRPASLRHQLTFAEPDGGIERADDIRLNLIPRAPISIGPPLRGGRWLAVEGPGNHLSHHWGSMVAIDGTLSIPQRYAIDWFGLDAGNHSVRGAHDSLAATSDEDWVGYRHDVLAVADGVVVDARDGAPNGKPLAPETVSDDLTARTLYGNFVILRIARGIYAHYAHFERGSVAVRIGQRIRRGAVIGRLGQSGAAGAPHLHFHLSNRQAFERSQGLPYVIQAFTALGQSKIEDTFDAAKPVALAPSPKGSKRAEMPLDGTVVTFP